MNLEFFFFLFSEVLFCGFFVVMKLKWNLLFACVFEDPSMQENLGSS
jgi:hypothetical protein